MKEAKQERRAMRWLALIFMLAAIGGCGDKITNNYTTINEGPASNVSVWVNGWRCGVGDYVNNDGPGRFSSERAFRAELVFEYINGFTHSQFTDDSSEVSLGVAGRTLSDHRQVALYQTRHILQHAGSPRLGDGSRRCL